MKISNILCLALYGDQAASHRVRLSQYVEVLKPFGYDLAINSLLVNDYVISLTGKTKIPFLKLIFSFIHRAKLLFQSDKYDLLVVHCELFPFMPAWVERFFLKKPYIYDFDDAFYLKYIEGKYGFLEPLLGKKFQQIISNAAVVTAGNKNLMKYALQYNNNVVILPSVVDTNRYYKKNRYANNIFTLGWIGSPSTVIYLDKLKVPLSKLGRKIQIRLIVIGAEAPKIENISIESVPWSLDTEIDLINQFDVGLMPLKDDEWSRGKCSYKLIQYMACGVCVIASSVGSNNDVVNPACGILIDNDNDWHDSILKLAQDSDLREAMGEASLEHIASNYSLESNAPIFSKALNLALSSGKL